MRTRKPIDTNTEAEAKPMQRRPERRTPVGGPRNVLTVTNKEPGYVYRVVNDVGDRVEYYKELGYEVVDDPKVRVGDRRAGKRGQVGTPVEVLVGQGIKGVVMRQREEFYNEDQKAKEANIVSDEETMYKRARSEESDYGDLRISKKS